MTGIWLGYYKFDKEVFQKASGFDKTFFTITIQSFNDNNFKGIVIEDIKSGGMEGTGEIIGKIEVGKIFFKKFMPKRLTLYPNGERKYEDEKHPTLYYRGTFSKDKKEINGEWKFKIRIGLLFGFIPILHRPGKGSWSMTLQ